MILKKVLFFCRIFSLFCELCNEDKKDGRKTLGFIAAGA